MSIDRVILHVDMDAFFASVECADDPSLRGLPLLVGGRSGRGVVAAASYAARTFGCRSAMPMSTALRLCPHAVVRPVRMDRYREVSDRVFAIFDRFTPLVEPLSVDEAFLDLTGTLAIHGSAHAAAVEIRRLVAADTACTASVGVSHNKFLAKLASDLHKPDGLTVFGHAEVATLLPTLPISRIWGIGPKTAARLEGYAIRTIGDLAQCDPGWLSRRVGVDADRYLRLARGQDDRPVTPDRGAKSVGQERTFAHNLTAPDDVRSALLSEVEQVGRRLRRAGILTRGVTVKIRTGDFRTITRAAALPAPADTTAALWTAALALFDTWAAAHFEPVRLIGVTARPLCPPDPQLDLFAAPAIDRQRRLDAAVDRINERFGRSAIRRPGPGRAKP